MLKLNLRLNIAKCAEIIFYDSRRKRQPVQPPPLPNVPRVQSLKILGVTISSKLSVAEHVCNINRSSAQTCHALRLLRAHGMANASLQVVYRAIITAKLQGRIQELQLGGHPLLPFPSPPFLPLPSFPFPSLPSPPLEVGQLKSS